MKILLLDIETFPNIAFVWGKYQQDVIRYVQEGCIATFVAKWLDGKMISRALPDYAGYKPSSYDDKLITKDLWKLFDEADAIVAHNGKDFDLKVCRARFIYHNLPPPSPVKCIDTKDIVKKVARFNSAKMDDLGQLLGYGKKIKTDFDLWEGCIRGDRESWRLMIKYNRRDVILLEKVYKRLLPWIGNHPNMGIGKDAVCPKCGSERVQFRGVTITTTQSYQRFQCQDCGGWGRMTKRTERAVVTHAQTE